MECCSFRRAFKFWTALSRRNARLPYLAEKSITARSISLHVICGAQYDEARKLSIGLEVLGFPRSTTLLAHTYPQFRRRPARY